MSCDCDSMSRVLAALGRIEARLTEIEDDVPKREDVFAAAVMGVILARRKTTDRRAVVTVAEAHGAYLTARYMEGGRIDFLDSVACGTYEEDEAAT